jgi:hypothetical protein
MVVGAWAYSDMPWPLDDGAEVDYSSKDVGVLLQPFSRASMTR